MNSVSAGAVARRKYVAPYIAGEPRGAYTPEQALLAGILERVCDDLQRATGVETVHARNEVRQILAWLDSADTDWGSFLFICDHLDLSPEAARANVRAGERP